MINFEWTGDYLHMQRIEASFMLVGLLALGGCDLESKSVGDRGETGSGGTDVGQVESPDDFWAQLGAAHCIAMTDCDCSDPTRNYESLGVCLDAISEGYAPQRIVSEQAGMEFSPDCASTFLDFFDTMGCGATSNDQTHDIMMAGYTLSCSVFSGSKLAGESCTLIGGPFAPGITNECAEGLFCSGDTQSCVPMPPGPELVGGGESCLRSPIVLDDDIEIEIEDMCPVGFSCDRGGSNLCVPLGAIGEACSSMSRSLGPLCVDGATCDQETELCVARAGLGEACEYSDDCSSYACDELTGLCSDEAPACVVAPI